MPIYGQWSYVRLTGDKGADGVSTGVGLRADKALTNVYNRRDTSGATEEFTFTPSATGIDTTDVTYSWNLQGVFESRTINDDSSITVKLHKDRSSNFSVSVTLVVSESEQYTSDTLRISDVDGTPDASGMFLGLLEEEPTVLTGLIDNDYYVDEDGDAFELINGIFKPMSSVDSRYVVCANAIFASGITLPTSSNMGQWVGNLVSQNIVSQKIFSGEIDASSATFNNLTINDTSWFKGNIDSDVLKSYNGQSSSSQATCASPTMYWRLSEAISALDSNDAVKTQNVIYNGTTYPYAVYVTDADSNFASQTLSVACPKVNTTNTDVWYSTTFTIPYNWTGSLNIGKAWGYGYGSYLWMEASLYETAPMELYINSSSSAFATYSKESANSTSNTSTTSPSSKYWVVPSRAYTAGDTITLKYKGVNASGASISGMSITTGMSNYTATTTIYAKWSAYGLTSNSLCLLGQKIDTANTKLTSYALINGSEYRKDDTISLASKRWCTWDNNIRVDGQQYANGECQVTGTVSVTINGSSIGFTPTRCIWGTNGITFYDASNSVNISRGSWYTGFNFSFTYTTSGSYLKVDNIEPIDSGQTNIGTETDKFNSIWVKNLNADDLVDKIYPIGSIYLNITDTSPSTLFSNTTWEKLSAGYALWTASEGAGETISAGLPNIKGRINQTILFQNNTSSGAFSSSRTSTRMPSSSSQNAYIFDTSFDAKNGECDINGNYKSAGKVYGNSDTVQPPAYKVYAWRRIS